MPERDALDALIAGAAGWDDRELADDPVLRAALDELCGEVMAVVRPRRRLRLRLGRNRMMLAAVVGTVLVVCGAPLAGRLADRHHSEPQPPLRSGLVWQSPGGGYQILPDGEPQPGTWELRNGVGWINLASPALPAVIDGVGRVFALPPGGSWSYVKAHPPGHAWVPANDLGRTMLRQAVCQWEYYWLDRSDHHDVQRAATAWLGLARVSAWTFVTPDEAGWYSTVTVISGAVRADPTLVRHDLDAGCHPQMWSPGVAR